MISSKLCFSFARHSRASKRCLSVVAPSEEVWEAVRSGKPVVALESTIISHGMPWPENLELAKEVEELVRAGGAVPATVCVSDGKLRVGTSDKELEALARGGSSVWKCSRRDLARATSSGVLGATTVSGTMVGAHAAGVGVFATGGIGGVHRGVEETMDVSADVTELGRTPVAVVCAGVKSILDIPKTLEALETYGVFVASVGSEGFPAFFSPDSGVKSPAVVQDAEEAAKITHHSIDELKLQSGLLFAVPNPEPAEGEQVEQAIQQALQDAHNQNISGRDVTPFILSQVNKRTHGASLRSNLALVRNNVRFATQMAKSLSNLRHRGLHTTASGRVVVYGGTMMDVYAAPKSELSKGASCPGVVESRAGGVGRNIAASAGLWTSVGLHTSLGSDVAGEALRTELEGSGVTVLGHRAERTSHYVAMLDGKRNLYAAVADTNISLCSLEELEPDWNEVDMVVGDANLGQDAMTKLGDECVVHHRPLWIDPVGPMKSRLLTRPTLLGQTAVLTPDAEELCAMADTWREFVDEKNIPAPSREDSSSSDSDSETESGTKSELGLEPHDIVAMTSVLPEGLLNRPDVQQRMRDLGISAEDVSDFLEQHSSPPTSKSTTHNSSVQNLPSGVLGDAHCLLAALCNPGAVEANVALVEGKKHLLATLGERGTLWLSRKPCSSIQEWWDMCQDDFFDAALGPNGFDFSLVAAAPILDPVNVSGAGDTLLGTTVALVSKGLPMSEALLWATAASRLTVQRLEPTPDPHAAAYLAHFADIRPQPASENATAKDLALDAIFAVCDANRGLPSAARILEQLKNYQS